MEKRCGSSPPTPPNDRTHPGSHPPQEELRRPCATCEPVVPVAMQRPNHALRRAAGRPVALLLVVAAAALAAPATPAAAGLLDSLTEDVRWSGYLKNETAYRIKEPRSFTKMRNTLFLSASYPFGSRYELTASGWAYYDLVYDLFDYRTISGRAERDRIQPLAFVENLAQEKDSGVVDVREFYLDIFFDNLDIRIGRQFVVWGVLTGVRIVDEINPMDFRELITPDLLDYRIPLWMLRADYYWGNTSLQYLWIPDLRFHKPAPRGSEWELLQEVTDPDGNRITTFPAQTFRNAEWAVRLSQTIGMTELTFSYFSTWDDFPVIFRRVPVDATVGSPDPQFFPSYTRIHMYGTTFQRPIGSTVIKGEAAYVTDKFFGVGGLDLDRDGFVDSFGEVQSDHIRWGLGIDFVFMRADVSVGIMQWLILDYIDEMVMDEDDTSINFFIRKELPARRAVVSLLGIALVNLNEGYLKPKITFDVTDRFQIGVGADLFWGEKSQLGVGFLEGRPTSLIEIDERSQFLGNFHANDRLFVEFKYAF